MERQVIFRDRQELQAVDTNNVQDFVATSLEHLCLDAIGDGEFFSGLSVSKHTQTEIKIGSGRFWRGGKVYLRDVNVTRTELQSDTYSLFNYLPITHSRLVAVLAYGQEIETDVQPRDFLVNLETGETEPQAVPMQRLRLCGINLLPGVESPVPQLPVVPPGSILVATVRLTTTGIDSIAANNQGRIPVTSNLQADISNLLLWQSLTEPIIGSIRSDLAALWDVARRSPNNEFLLNIAADVAWLKEKQQVGDNYSNYAADWFVNPDESDTANAAYNATILDGLRFAIEAQASANLALFNPNDPNVSRHDTVILPKYDNVKRLATTGYAGELTLTWQFQTVSYVMNSGRSYSHRYGWSIQVSNRWWTSGYAQDNAERLLASPGPYYQYTWDNQDSWGTTQQIVGSLISQTALISNAMWLTQVGLFFTAIDAVGDVTLIVSETEHGKPELSRSIAVVTIPRTSLKRYPEETLISVPPVFLKAGGRYAFSIITQGAHRVALTGGKLGGKNSDLYRYYDSNTNSTVVVPSMPYSEGTLFVGADGDYLVADTAKDIMANIYAAKFVRSRTEIPLQSLSLAGGITNILIESKQAVPDGCEIHFEFQKDGLWRRMSDAAFHLQTKPDLIPIRVVMVGTSELAPMLELAANGLKGWRSQTSFTHLSTLRTLAVASTSITVKVDVSDFVPANHSLTCQLRKTDNTLISPTVTKNTDEGDGVRRFTFTFSIANPGISQYKVQLNGSRNSNAVQPFSVLSRIDIAA